MVSNKTRWPCRGHWQRQAWSTGHLRWGAILATLLLSCAPATQADRTATPASPPADTISKATATPPLVSQVVVSPTPVASVAPTAFSRPSDQPRYGGTLRVTSREEPKNWDIHAAGGATSYQALGQVFQLPIRYDWPPLGSCTMPMQNDALEEWRWLDNGLTFEGKLRENIRFHNKPPVNGRPVTAQDVVFSLQRMNEKVDAVAVIAGMIQDFQVVDSRTFRIHLKSVAPWLAEEYLTFYRGSYIAAAESAGTNKQWTDPEQTWIGSGPFTFERWIPGVKYTFKKNPGYSLKNLPYVDALEMLVMPDASTRTASLMSGKADLVTEVPAASALTIARQRPDILLQECPYFSGTTVFNLRNDLPPANDVRVRRAISMAIDRKALVDLVLLGKGTVEAMILSHHRPWSLAHVDYPSEVRKYLDYRPDEAKALLREAGYRDGLDLTLYTTNYYGYPYNAMFEAMGPMLAKADIRLKIKWLPRAEYTATYEGRGEVWTGMLYNRMGQATPARWLNEYFHSKSPIGANRSRVNDPQMDHWLDEFSVTLDPQKQLDLARKIQIRAVDHAYVIVPLNNQDFAAYAPRVKVQKNLGFHVYMRGQTESLWLSQ